MCIDCAIEDVKLASSIGCLSMLVFPALKMHRVIMNFQEGSHFVNMDPFRYLHCFLPSRVFFILRRRGLHVIGTRSRLPNDCKASLSKGQDYRERMN